jgi:hypothetical protein
VQTSGAKKEERKTATSFGLLKQKTATANFRFLGKMEKENGSFFSLAGKR